MCSKLAIKAVCDGVKFIPPQNRKPELVFFFRGNRIVRTGVFIINFAHI